MLKKILAAPGAGARTYLVPFILVSLLYFIWGTAHGLLDTLNKHFQGTFDMSKAESGFLQVAMYMGYFVMALPAGWIMRKLGYKKGIILGLGIAGAGAFTFVPAAFTHTPAPFLAALFILACGLCVVETGAHPYVTMMGPEKNGAQRINIAAAFNGVGWIIGPLLGGFLLFTGDTSSFVLAKPYMIVGGGLFLIAAGFALTRLPEITDDAKELKEEALIDLGETPNADEIEEGSGQECSAKKATRSPFSYPLLKWGIIAQFLYCGAQIGIFSFFINYVTEINPDMSNLDAAKLLGFGGMTIFLVGRLASSYIMSKISPGGLLALFGLAGAMCMGLVVASVGTASLYALYASFFFMSMMFPTIFALSVRGMSAQETKSASPFIVMGVVGGAVFPPIMGALGASSMGLGFIAPLIAFVYIAYFGLIARRRA